jgi:nitroreductase
LRELIDLARNTPSAGNKQPLKYYLVCGEEANAKVFETLGWAASLPEWTGPDGPERPTAYIVVIADAENGWNRVDLGIASQTILLGAVERGLGGCMFGNIRKNKLRAYLEIPEDLEVALVIALGVPVEKVVLVPVEDADSTTYFRDSEGTHYVPKRSLDQVIVGVKDR